MTVHADDAIFQEIRGTIVATIPDAVIGTCVLDEGLLSSAPADVNAALVAYQDWSVVAFALPIRDEVLWAWHKHGDHRSLFANYVLNRAAASARSVCERHGLAWVDLADRFAGRVSLVELAQRCGLGTRGVNNLLLHPTYGAWLQLHAFIVACRFSPAKSVGDVCIQCMNCVSACPAHAIERDGGFYAASCTRLVASYWNPRSKAVALTANSYIECAECISNCPIGSAPERIFEWKR